MHRFHAHTIVYTLNVYVPFSLLSFGSILFTSLHTWYSIRCLIPFVSRSFRISRFAYESFVRQRREKRLFNRRIQLHDKIKTTIVSKSIRKSVFAYVVNEFCCLKNKINEQTSQELKQIMCNWLCDRKKKSRASKVFFLIRNTTTMMMVERKKNEFYYATD